MSTAQVVHYTTVDFVTVQDTQAMLVAVEQKLVDRIG